MIQTKKWLTLLLIVSYIPCCINKTPNAQQKVSIRQNAAGFINPAPRLSDLRFKSASVLPYYRDRKKVKKVILSREAYGKDKMTYDDFGGSRDRGEDHPVVTAAREFYEEANIPKTVGLTLPQTQDYIDIAKTKNTKYIIAYSNKQGTCNVTFVTSFDPYKDALFKNFYDVRKHETRFHYKEKDRLAIVTWQNLKNAITGHNRNWFSRSFFRASTQNIKVNALVQDPRTKKFHQQIITLRPFLVKKLRMFFMGDKYQQGLNKKIRFYNE